MAVLVPRFPSGWRDWSASLSLPSPPGSSCYSHSPGHPFSPVRAVSPCAGTPGSPVLSAHTCLTSGRVPVLSCRVPVPRAQHWGCPAPGCGPREPLQPPADLHRESPSHGVPWQVPFHLPGLGLPQPLPIVQSLSIFQAPSTKENGISHFHCSVNPWRHETNVESKETSASISCLFPSLAWKMLHCTPQREK